MRSFSSRFLILLCLSLLAFSCVPRALAQNTRPFFYWTEVPVNQKVMISAAAFYPEGFELIDTAGHKILVPFNFGAHHLFVMKFGVSPDNTLFFMNHGDYPILYLPTDSYLVNGLWGDVRWYPFTPSFHPTQPVFISVTPAFPGYMAMKWYPGMYFYGGFWSGTPWKSGQRFPATPGLEIIIGSLRFDNWKSFINYWKAHPSDRNFDNYWKSHPIPTSAVGGQNIGPGGSVTNFGGGLGSGNALSSSGGQYGGGRSGGGQYGGGRSGGGQYGGGRSGFSSGRPSASGPGVLSMNVHPGPKYLPVHPIFRRKHR